MLKVNVKSCDSTLKSLSYTQPHKHLSNLAGNGIKMSNNCSNKIFKARLQPLQNFTVHRAMAEINSVEMTNTEKSKVGLRAHWLGVQSVAN